MNNPWALKDEAQTEAYEYFDKNIRKLSRSNNGQIDMAAQGLQDNDVDAFRHAYVSGIFTQIYGESTADVFGRLNEFLTADLYSNSRNPRALNMDLWNNQIGRTYGKTTKTRRDLLRKIHRSLKSGELIIDPSDMRNFRGARSNPANVSKPILVLSKDKKGRNQLFADVIQKIVLTRLELVSQIRVGAYPSYSVKKIGRMLVPVSNPDSSISNNLG